MTDSIILSFPKLKINLKRTHEQSEGQISGQSSSQKIEVISPRKVDLIDDCLAEIFMYIPIYERPKMALVCKQWNRALQGTWYRVKKLEFPYWEYSTPRNILEQYKRKNFFLLDFLVSLLDNCGWYLTELDLGAYGCSSIVPSIDQYCPNLVKLRLIFKNMTSNYTNSAYSGLSKLKVLKLIFHGPVGGILAVVFNSLTNVSDTLNELSLTYWSGYVTAEFLFPNSFPAILSQFKNLQKLEMIGIKITSNLHEFLKNAGLNGFLDNYRGICKNLPARYIFIKTLDFMYYEITDDVLYTFVNCIPFLRSIKASFTHVTDDGIQTISMIKKLKSLYLYGANQHITDSSIKLLKNLEELRLPYNNKITNVSVTEVLNNSPKMRWLSIMHTSVTPEFSKTASEIASKREEYLILCVSFNRKFFSSQGYQLPYMKIHHHDSNIEIDGKFRECSSERVDLIQYE